MKKLLLICLPVLLTGCSSFNQLVERMQTDTLEYLRKNKPTDQGQSYRFRSPVWK